MFWTKTNPAFQRLASLTDPGVLTQETGMAGADEPQGERPDPEMGVALLRDCSFRPPKAEEREEREALRGKGAGTASLPLGEKSQP